MPGFTRRQFIARATALTGAQFLAPIVGRAGPWLGQAAADPVTAARRRLVVVFLQGGNDGLNTVIPTGDVAGAPRYSVYRQVRPSIAYAPAETLPLDAGTDAGEALGLNSQLQAVHRLYGEGRLAVVQGVDYPNHSYSHFTSADTWQAGAPAQGADSGWIGRHLDRVGIGDGELRAVGIGTDLPLLLRGHDRVGAELASLASAQFVDGASATARARHDGLRAFAAYPDTDVLRHAAGVQLASAADLVDLLAQAPAEPPSPHPMTAAMLTARTLLEDDLGVECVFVPQPGSYDTHVQQRTNQETVLAALDAGLEAFFYGTEQGQPCGTIGPLAPAVADRTVVMVVSEFGRRIGENGSGAVAGTDHGAAAPVLMIGPSGTASAGLRLVPGLHGAHPDLGTPLLPTDNLAMTTDLRSLVQTVLQTWLGDPDPGYANVPIMTDLFTSS